MKTYLTFILKYDTNIINSVSHELIKVPKTLRAGTDLLYEQFLAHCDALVESLLIFLQQFLLFINLPSQVTIGLFQSNKKKKKA